MWFVNEAKSEYFIVVSSKKTVFGLLRCDEESQRSFWIESRGWLGVFWFCHSFLRVGFLQVISNDIQNGFLERRHGNYHLSEIPNFNWCLYYVAVLFHDWLTHDWLFFRKNNETAQKLKIHTYLLTKNQCTLCFNFSVGSFVGRDQKIAFAHNNSPGRQFCWIAY